MNQPVSKPQIAYSERVLPSFGSFLPVLLLIPTGLLTLAPVNGLLGLLIGAGLSLLVIAILVATAPVISVRDGQLRVGQAQISLKLTGKASPIAREDSFAERGTKLNARAFTKFQPSIKTLVRVEIKDAGDPTPYWLFSSRNPEELAALLNSTKK